MMLKENVQNKKRIVVIVAAMACSLIILVSCGVQPEKENNSYITKGTESGEVSAVSGGGEKAEAEEVSAIYGDWKITEYLGESVEYHGAEATTEAEKNENEEIIMRIKEKYLNTELHIDAKNVAAFSSPTELGYRVSTWDDMFLIYRQPSDIWDGISPPFICISFSLKDFDDSFDLIIDTNGIATLLVKGQFFRLEKIVTD